MQIAPLFPMAAGLIAGIVLDEALELPFLAYILTFVVCGLPAISSGVRRTIGLLLIFLAAMSVGGALHLRAARTVPSSSLERYADEIGRIARIRGTVVSEPQVLGDSPNPFAKWTYQGERTVFLLEADSIEGMQSEIAVTGRIRVTVHDAVLDLNENEKVEVFGWLYALTPPQNPGGFDWRGYLRRQGVVARMNCDHRLNLRRFGESPNMGRTVTWLRTKVRGLLTDDLVTGTPEEVSLLEAMVLGHRSRFDRRLNEVFIRAGVIHFIAVSGTNVVILMSFVWSIGRLLRRTKRRCTWLMVIAVITYALVADPRPPILRATVMGLLFCIALLLRRPQAHFNWICAAAIILILIDPTTVFDAGFQLSFAAVLGVGYLAPALLRALISGGLWFERVVLARPYAIQDRQLARAAATPLLGPRRYARRLWRAASKYVVLLVFVSAGAWFAGLPIVTAYFHRVQPWGAISSAMVFPLVSLVMVLGVLKVAVTAISPGLALLVATVLDVTDGWVVHVVEVLAGLPGTDVTASTPPWWLVVAYYAFLIVLVLKFPPVPQINSASVFRAAQHPRQQPIPTVWFSAALAMLILCIGTWSRPTGGSEQVRVTVLAVGLGSATVIELPDGRTVLYDAGTSLPYDVGRSVVGPFLNLRGIRRIDRVYLSHPNLDHFSGLPTLLDQIDADAVIINSCFEPRGAPGSPSRHLLELLSIDGQSVQVLDTSTSTWEIGGVEFELLWPRGECDDDLSANETSTVLRLSYAGRSILLTGDIEDRAQTALLARGELHADVLLLPHHGSVRSTTREFLAAVGAKFLVRSSGQRMARTDNGLIELLGDTPIYNTADVGAVTIVLDREGVHVNAQNLNKK